MPECITCKGYISVDFARVFGDNERIVRSCPSCHGNRPEKTTEVAVPVQADGGTGAATDVERTVGTDGDGENDGERVGGDAKGTDERDAPPTASRDERQETPTDSAPETDIVASPLSSGVGFLKSVLGR